MRPEDRMGRPAGARRNEGCLPGHPGQALGGAKRAAGRAAERFTAAEAPASGPTRAAALAVLLLCLPCVLTESPPPVCAVGSAGARSSAGAPGFAQAPRVWGMAGVTDSRLLACSARPAGCGRIRAPFALGGRLQRTLLHAGDPMQRSGPGGATHATAISMAVAPRSSAPLTALNLRPVAGSGAAMGKTAPAATRGAKSAKKSTVQGVSQASAQAEKVSSRRSPASAKAASRISPGRGPSGKQREVLVELALPERRAKAAKMMGILWHSEEHATAPDVDMEAEASAVLAEYSSPETDFGVWHDHAPALYLAYLKSQSKDEDRETRRRRRRAAAELKAASPKKGQKACTCAPDGTGALPETGPNGHFFSVGANQVDVKKFMHCVEDLGGSDRITSCRQWSEVARQMGIDTKSVRYASTSLKRMHMLLETSARKSAAGSLHWRDGEGGGGLVLDAFLDHLADRRPLRRSNKAKRAIGTTTESVVVLEERRGRDDESSSEEGCVQYLVEELGVRASAMGRIFTVCPQLRHLSVPNNLRPTVRFLVEEARVPEDKLAKIIGSFPQVLGLSVDANLRPMLRYLVDVVGIGEDKIGKVLVTRPQLLAQCIEKNLVPKIRTLLDIGGIPEEQLGSAVAKQPHILGLSDGHIRDCLNFLTDELDIATGRVGKMLVNSPQVLGLSLESNLRPKIKFLVETVGVPKSKVGVVIGKFPNILGYSIESNMLPKLQYLADEVLHVPLRKMGRVLVTCPQLLGYSLDKRIKPRHMLLKRRNMRLSISRMLAPSDLEFRRILRAANTARQQEQEDQDQSSLSFEERHGITSVEKMNSNGNIRPSYGDVPLPESVEVGEDGEVIVPLNPKTMSGLYYWHFQRN